MDFFAALETLFAQHPVRIDRPRGSVHPRHPDVVYPLDYGFLEGTTAGDGGGVDVFRGTTTGAGLVGAYLTVDLGKGDLEAKLLLDCSPEEVATVGRFLTEALGLSPLLVDSPARRASCP